MAVLQHQWGWGSVHLDPHQDDTRELQGCGRTRCGQSTAPWYCQCRSELDVRSEQRGHQVGPQCSSTGQFGIRRQSDHGHCEGRFHASCSACGRFSGRVGRTGAQPWPTSTSSSPSSSWRQSSTSGWSSSELGSSRRFRFLGVEEVGRDCECFEKRAGRFQDFQEEVEEKERQEEPQPKRRAQEKEEVKAQKLQLFPLLFGEPSQPEQQQQQLRQVEDGGQVQGCVSRIHGQGGHQEVQEESRFAHLRGEAPWSPHRKLHQRIEAEVDAGRNLEDQPASRHRDDGVRHYRSGWPERGTGSPRSHDNSTGNGPYQPKGGLQSNGCAGNADHGSSRSQEQRRVVGQSQPKGAHPRGGKQPRAIGADWSRLIGQSVAKPRHEGLGFMDGCGTLGWDDLIRNIPAKLPIAECAGILPTYVQSTDGILGRMLRDGAGKLLPLTEGVSPAAIFPLPLMRPANLPTRGQGRLRAKSRNSILSYVNLTIACMNFMYCGSGAISKVEPSAAQRRVHNCIFTTASHFLRSGLVTSGEKAIQEFLLENLHDYGGGGGHALPLGLRAGVPELAAQVELSQVLQGFDPRLAEQVEHPSSLLLPAKKRPTKIPKPFCKLDASYPEYVKRNTQAGLQVLMPRKRIYKIKGKTLYSGAFAVAKNLDEDRAISALCPLNTLVDATKLWKPRFAIMSAMRCMRLPPCKLLRVYKKDARHFFHFLKIGHRWNKYMAHPPLKASSDHEERYPVHRGVPMGFTAAAAWAQAYNEAKAVEVSLPRDARLIDSQPPPQSFPIWGSILDDVWALEECNSLEDPPGIGSKWLHDVATAWTNDGVVEHQKKAVDGAAREEVQGVMVDGVQGTLGVSLAKRGQLFEAGLYLLAQSRPLVGEVDRWLGKLSFALSFKPCARAVLQDIYTWLSEHRGKAVRAKLWPSVRAEIAVSLTLIPFLEVNLRADWCSRVEASDAAPGGHGRAWAHVHTGVVAEVSRLSSHKGVYTNLQSEHGVALNEKGECPLQQVKFPVDSHKWKTAARKGGYKHITIEEAVALNWSLLSRLQRPDECGSRVLHLVDSAAVTGAYKKGRSASRQLNGCCRQACAITCCAGIEPFFTWVPTTENPADEPSSRNGIRAIGVRTVQPKPREVHHVADQCLKQQSFWDKEHPWVKHLLDLQLASSTPAAYEHGLPKLFLHLCSGPARRGDFCDELIRMARRQGEGVVVIRVDPIIHPLLDLTDGNLVISIRELCQQNRVQGMLGSPPCSTWSRARHVPLQRKIGPRPLRSRQYPWICLPHRTKKEIQACESGSRLLLACVYLMGFCLHGWRGLEHPRDPGKDPCNHQWHEPHIGLGTTGQFKTFPLAQYPKEFCSRLADLARNYTPYSVCSAGHGAWEDFYQAAAFPFEHPAKQVATAIHQCTQPFQR